MTTTKMESLQAKLKELKGDKQTIEYEIAAVESEIEAIQLAAYPHKVGDVIAGRGGTPVKIVRIVASHDDVFPVVRAKLPSGGWSKKERFMINWDRVLSDDK